MRLVTVVLVVLLVLIQYPLWWGHGGWLRVHELQQQLAQQQQQNAKETERNNRIEGEVQDLQGGTAAVEERARYEMGMMKDGEVFVQFVSPNAPPPVPSSAVSEMSSHGDVSAAPVSIVPNPVSRVPQRRERARAGNPKRDVKRDAKREAGRDAKKRAAG
ncbi:cell division protein FtsB [Burkholderia sp. WAC0059]|uniref:cell division protein FtsB n=1 Tax=Burkholderia sp. WAC0059 TaxID=2066022 RepID=UPI000C7EDA7F|nr:cell division protein FtsB [Burkholderia sp. WAC0059]PLZ02750.1 cell division protein FtsB [Burkholderia sp. WAC0059]